MLEREEGGEDTLVSPIKLSMLTELLKVIKREVKEAGQGWASPLVSQSL